MRLPSPLSLLLPLLCGLAHAQPSLLTYPSQAQIERTMSAADRVAVAKEKAHCLFKNVVPVVVNAAALDSDELSVTLPTGTTLTFKRVPFASPEPTRKAWTGHTQNKSGELLALYGQDHVSARITVGAEVFVLRQAGTGYVLSQSNRAALPPND